jgi:hypothetical protein
VLTENDGSFRRLVQTVRERQVAPGGRPGRPPKHRTPTTGRFVVCVHKHIEALAKQRTEKADHLVSISDLYNEASRMLITDLHQLLGDELRLPAGAVTLSGVLGLRELIDRPVVTPLRKLELRGEQKRTTLHLDPLIRDALLEMSFRFGLQMRRNIHMHRLLELAAAWYLAGVESPSD